MRVKYYRFINVSSGGKFQYYFCLLTFEGFMKLRKGGYPQTL
jgi:hypothetical protein